MIQLNNLNHYEDPRISVWDFFQERGFGKLEDTFRLFTSVRDLLENNPYFKSVEDKIKKLGDIDELQLFLYSLVDGYQIASTSYYLLKGFFILPDGREVPFEAAVDSAVPLKKIMVWKVPND